MRQFVSSPPLRPRLEENWCEVDVSAKGKTFKTATKGQDGGGVKFVPPKHLGYVCDPALTGAEHVKHMQGKAQGKMHTIQPIAAHLGETAALEYIQEVVAPSVLYGGEVVGDPSVQLDKVEGMAIGEALLTGKANRWASGDSWVRREGLRWHSKHLPWGQQVKQRRVSLFAKISTAAAILLDRHHLGM